MKSPRPVNLNLLSIRFPLPAIVSILHRISGVVLFLALPFALWGLNMSLASQQDFDDLHQFLMSPFMKMVLWCLLSALIYHVVAGVRHLFMDLGYGETLEGGQLGARYVILISALFIILTGIWLW